MHLSWFGFFYIESPSERPRGACQADVVEHQLSVRCTGRRKQVQKYSRSHAWRIGRFASFIRIKKKRTIVNNKEKERVVGDENVCEHKSCAMTTIYSNSKLIWFGSQFCFLLRMTNDGSADHIYLKIFFLNLFLLFGLLFPPLFSRVISFSAWFFRVMFVVFFLFFTRNNLLFCFLDIFSPQSTDNSLIYPCQI